MFTNLLCPCTTCDDSFPIELSLDQCASAETADMAANGVPDWSSCRYLELLPSPAGKRRTKQSASSDRTASAVKDFSDATATPSGLLNECAKSTNETSGTSQENMKEFSFNSNSHPPNGHEDTPLSLALAHFLLGPLTMQQPLQPCFTTDSALPGTGISAESCDVRGPSDSVPCLEGIFDGLPTPMPSPGSEAGEGASSTPADSASTEPGCTTPLLEPLAAEIGTAIAVGNGVEPCIASFPLTTEEEDQYALSPQDISGFPEITDMTSSPSDFPFMSLGQEHQRALSAEQPITANASQLSPSIEEWLPNLADYLACFANGAGSSDAAVHNSGLQLSSRDFSLKTQASQKDAAVASADHCKSYRYNGPLEKNFQCSICKRRYARKGYLDRHMRTHSKA